MANQDHQAIFQQGVEVWNQWRKEHRDICPDLSGIDFTSAHLNDVRLSFSQLKEACFRSAQLQRAYFVSSDLSNVDFRNALLTNAHLDGAKLKRADLNGTKLQQAKIRTANLQWANLSGADLSFTDLDRSNFSNANLHETDFRGARIRFTEFFNVDFSTAKGLDTVIHDGSSHLGIQTLSRSLKHLPAVFLRGTGVPASMLTYTRSHSGKPIAYPTCFLSYASSDQNFAEQLQTDLQAHDVLCWSTPYDGACEEKSAHIDESIFIYDALLLVISEHSTTEVSHQALNSIVKRVLLRERLTSVLFSIHLDKDPQEIQGVWPRLLRLTKHPSSDFSQWNDHHAYQEALHQLLHDLRISNMGMGQSIS